jgi:hypothetical protein
MIEDHQPSAKLKSGKVYTCRYRHCGQEFTPNPRNRTKHKQEYCCPLHRTLEWQLNNPRVPVGRLKELEAAVGKGKR